MKFTKDWLDVHLKTNKSESQIIQKLNSIGLEVEKVEPVKNELSDFIVAKIIKANKHPNADRLKLCDVDIGKKDTLKVVCGAPNARDGLLTIYAPPGSVIPKNGMKLEVSKIRGETSYGMLCSESELKLSNESEGIIDLNDKYKTKIGKSFFGEKKGKNVIELSITPNRPDCLGVRGIARDLSASNFGKLKEPRKSKVKKNIKHNLKIKIEKNKNQACSIFGSCIIKNIKNTESPKWLKEKILSLGQKPISAVVDVTNYVMMDLNRPLHAYDADKINKGIIVRNSKKGESFEALDNKKYVLGDNMCVISDASGVLGLGGIIGGVRSGTELNTKNILLESAYFKPKSIRSTSKILNLDTDAKYRFERGIDPNSIEEGLIKAAELIQNICGGTISKINITKKEKSNHRAIKFPIDLFNNTTGFKVEVREMTKILSDLGFLVKKNKKELNLKVPSWRPDILQPIDIVEEIVRIKGYDRIKTELPEKTRNKQTLNPHQKLFHFLQRSVASKGYYETVTWSFTDSKINELFKEEKPEVKIVNPISSDLNVLRSSIFSNLIFYLKKNLDRDAKDVSLFEIGPIFSGKKPGQQEIVISAIKSGMISRLNWIEKERKVDVFDAKRDVMQTLIETGLDDKNFHIKSNAPNYYHPGKSGAIYQDSKSDKPIAFFGEIHPNINQKLQVKTEALILFEIFLDRIELHKNKLKDQKNKYEYSDFQKSERDFAFIIDKNLNVQELVKIIYKIDNNLIKNVKVFDLYEGENIPSDKKSIALNVTIQSLQKSLNDKDLEKINNLIISTVESKTGAKIRS